MQTCQTSREIKFRVWDKHTKSFFDTNDTHYLPSIKCETWDETKNKWSEEKLDKIKKEFDIKIDHAWGDNPSGFKQYCYECDAGVDRNGLWIWIKQKLEEFNKEAFKKYAEWADEKNLYDKKFLK